MDDKKEELNLTFTPFLWKSGGSYVVTVPMDWIKRGYCEKGDPLTLKVIAGLRHPKS